MWNTTREIDNRSLSRPDASRGSDSTGEIEGATSAKSIAAARLAPILNHQMQFVDKTIDFL